MPIVVPKSYPRPISFSDDEILIPLGGFRLEQEEGYLPPPENPAWEPPPNLAQQVSDTAGAEEILSPLGGFRLEQEECWFQALAVQSVPWVSLPFLDDEILEPLGGFRLEQEECWYLALSTEAVPWTPIPFSDDEILSPMGGFRLEQEECWFQALATSAVPWTPIPFSDDEILEPLGGFRLEQEECWYLALATERVSWTPIPFLDDEIASPLGGFRLEQEEGYQPPNTLITWLALPFSDTDEFSQATLKLEEEYWYTTTESNPWSPVPFTDDEILSPLGGFRLDHDEFWTLSIAKEGVPWTPISFSDDEAGPPPGVFYREQEECWFLAIATESIPWTPIPFSDDEILEPLGGFRLDHDEYWSLSIAKEVVPWTPIPFLDDEIAPPPTLFFREQEECWFLAIATESIPWNAIPFRDDEIGSSLGGFRLDQEDYWPLSTATEVIPWVSISFRDDEATVSVSLVEDDWSPPITSVTNWVTTLSVADEELTLGGFRLEQEECWFQALATSTVPWLSVTFLDEAANWQKTIPSYFNPQPIYYLSLSPNGSEVKFTTFDFAKKPFNDSGDIIVTSPAPVISMISWPPNQTDLNATIVYTASKYVNVTMSAPTDLAVNTNYNVFCRVTTTEGNVFIVNFLVSVYLS